VKTSALKMASISMLQ